MAFDKDLGLILHLISQHLIGDGPLFFPYQGMDIQGPEPVLPVFSQNTQVHGRCLKQGLHGGIFRVRISGQVQGHCSGDHWGCHRCSAGYGIGPVFLRGINRSRGQHIGVIPIIGVICQFPAVCLQCTDTDHVLICCRVSGHGTPLVSCRSHADHITVHCQLRISGKDICICPEGHVHHIRIAFNGIGQPEHQVRASGELSVSVCVTFDHDQV